MPPEFVTEKVCDLKHKEFHERCDLKHREVDGMKDDIKSLSDCVSKKFSTLNKWMYGLFGALILNLIIMLIKKG